MGKIEYRPISNFLLLLILFIFMLQIRRTTAEIPISEKIKGPKTNFSLPEFTAIDLFGNEISSSLFKGNNIYIQFINPSSVSQIESLKMIYQKYKNSKLIISVFVKDSNKYVFEHFLDKIEMIIHAIYIIKDNYEAYKKAFNSPSCCENFYLFNEMGNLIISSLNWKLYDHEVLTYFEKLGLNENFSILDFIKTGENVQNIYWLKEILEKIEIKGCSYYIISMFTNVCMSCLNGKIINELKKSYELLFNKFYFLIILSDNISENDIKNFKTIQKIKIPIIKADENLSKKWNQLIKEFGEHRLNNICFLLDKKGKVISVMNPSRHKEFFNSIFDLNEDL